MRSKRAGRSYWGATLLILAALCLDRLTKAWASLVLKDSAPCALLPGILRLTYTENTGAAFSMFRGNRFLLILVTALLVAAVLFYLFSRPHAAPARMGLALIAAGGLGNLYDRLAYGYVVDFLEPVFVRFAVFNLADVWVCAGVVLTAIGLFMEEGRKREHGA